MINRFNSELETVCRKINDRLCALVPNDNALTSEVSKAAVYSLSGGGKRLRPVLMMKFFELCGGKKSDNFLDIFCTIELVHTFSLIHDDLPCMDNDDYRRGRLSCHKAYPEAIALLAGDALSVLPFEIISQNAKNGVISYETAAKLTYALSHAIGIDGMIGGQVIDMLSENTQIPEETLYELQKKKTGALISASCEMGCILANADDKTISLAKEYADKLGLAFQIRDDILDVTGTFEELGKPIGSDKEQNKSTFVTLLGVDGAEKLCRELSEQAAGILSQFENSEFLTSLTKMLIDRRN